MKLTEAEMRMVFQIESTNQNAALNEIYMTWRYAPNPATKETAEGLLDKLRPLSDQECMDLHERDRKGSIQTTQEVEIYFNFVGRFVPPAFGEAELTPEELEEIRKREERKDRLHQNYLKRKARAVRQLSDTICVENGLSIVENPKPHGKSYNKWLGDQAKPSHRELLRVAIDNALSQSPANFEELLKLLKESGCEVSKRGKSYRLKLPGWEKAARMDSLGEGYGLDDLQAVLSGKKAHTPRKKIVTQAETQKVNLLVDIQAKLQAGKGAGYARWAKVFNLKQMAQTMNYLSENNLLEYAVLEEKAAAATAHHNELSAQIKAAEKRMAEIAVLRTHIVNYAKTREVYVAYRKAGYSKKFREEHEEEILLHQAAKNAFDEMGVKKLPKVKELQTEYAKLLEEKKKTYAEYRRSREEMRELLTAKANVDRVLKMEVEQDVEKEKDHGQR